MSEIVLTDAYVSIASNDLSDHCRQVTINYEADAAEKTAFGDNTHQFLGGLKNWSMEFEFNNDFASSSVDDVMFPLVGTAVTVAVRPTSSAKGATNPEYTGTGLIASYNPIPGNAVGDVSTATVSVQPAGDLSRATS